MWPDRCIKIRQQCSITVVVSVANVQEGGEVNEALVSNTGGEELSERESLFKEEWGEKKKIIEYIKTSTITASFKWGLITIRIVAPRTWSLIFF